MVTLRPMSIEKYYDWWMKNAYPYNSYVNVLSKKWTIQFTEDYNEYLKLF